MTTDAHACAIHLGPLFADQVDAIPSSDACPACGHSEFLHETILTSSGSFVICHEETERGECFRVRHSEGIPFGACQREFE
jgi:hypothetical protein